MMRHIDAPTPPTNFALFVDRCQNFLELSTHTPATQKTNPNRDRMLNNLSVGYSIIAPSVRSFLQHRENRTPVNGTMASNLGGYVDMGFIPGDESFAGSIAMDGDEYVRCNRCGYGGCDIRVSTCGCTIHTVRRSVLDFYVIGVLSLFRQCIGIPRFSASCRLRRFETTRSASSTSCWDWSVNVWQQAVDHMIDCFNVRLARYNLHHLRILAPTSENENSNPALDERATHTIIIFHLFYFRDASP
jgi:hypothetical protein